VAGCFGFAGVLSECFGEEAGYAQVGEPFYSFRSGYLKGGAKMTRLWSLSGYQGLDGVAMIFGGRFGDSRAPDREVPPQTQVWLRPARWGLSHVLMCCIL
jgi:hypothetical protein